jgi:predicted nucleotidyltransferase
MSELESRHANFDDLKKIINSLNEKNAEYILIGGYALYMHALYRTTTDIDILVPSNKESGKKIIDALLVLPDKPASKIDLSWFEEDATIRLADEIVIDIMFKSCGETYATLSKYLEIIDIDGIKVRTLNIEGLLLTKQATREKDIADKIALQKAINLKKTSNE